MNLVGMSLLLSLALLTIPIAHAIPSPSSPQGSAATITIASEIFVVDPANIVLDSTTIQPGAAGVSVDGQIVSADAAYDLYVDGSEILAGQVGVPITSSGATASGSTNSGSSSLSLWGTGSTVSISSSSISLPAGSTITPGTSSLGSNSLQTRSTGGTGSNSNVAESTSSISSTGNGTTAGTSLGLLEALAQPVIVLDPLPRVDYPRDLYPLA